MIPTALEIVVSTLDMDRAKFVDSHHQLRGNGLQDQFCRCSYQSKTAVHDQETTGRDRIHRVPAGSPAAFETAANRVAKRKLQQQGKLHPR